MVLVDADRGAVTGSNRVLFVGFKTVRGLVLAWVSAGINWCSILAAFLFVCQSSRVWYSKLCSIHLFMCYSLSLINV